MHRLPALALVFAFACDADSTSPPVLELYIDGALTVTGPAITFPDTALGTTRSATFELKNLGPGPVVLGGPTPFLLERDDRLSFRVPQPASREIAAGTSLPVEVRFVPTGTGPTTARILIQPTHLDEPISILLAGSALSAATADLVVTLDGAALPERYDFGSTPPNTAKTATLRLANRGTAPLDLGGAPVTLTDSSGAFLVGAITQTALAPDTHVEVPLTFGPRGCGPFSASLSVAVPEFGVFFVELRGQGGDNPLSIANATDTSQLRAPDLDVDISDPPAAGNRRIAIGNLTVGTFSGQVATLGWDGCLASQARVLSAASSGLTAPLFGNRVALSDDGRLLLITARDQRKDAWLFSLEADGTARFLATLLTFEEAFGHGRGAALSGDGASAFIGQTGATSGLNNHGAVFAYNRSGTAWVSQPEAKVKLLPSNPTQVELVGGWVATDRRGDVVVSGALATPVGAATSGPALAYLWFRPAEAGDGDWGRPIDGGEPNERHETVRLVTNEVPGDSSARVAVSADAGLIALGVATPETTRVHLFERVGDEFGLPSVAADERVATAVLTFASRPELRFVLGSGGDLFVAGDTLGLLELVRPTAGWVDRSINPTSAPDRQWTTSIYSQLALSPDDSTLVGVGANGTAWIIAR